MRPQSLTRGVTASLIVPLITLLAGITGLACDRAPPADGLKEWTAADHDGEKRAAPMPNQGARVDAGDANAQLVDATWRAQCANCHGPGGHGDGPQAAMYRPTNLAAEEFQSKITDEQIASSILNGKNRMPKFDLADPVLKGMVLRVRSFRGK